MEKDFRMLAKTFEGLEEVLSKEIIDLGGKNVNVQRRAVSFEGDMDLMYRANLWLRTAINILKPIASFDVENEKDLYDGIYAIKWFEYFDVGKSFSIDTVLVNSNITHSMFATYKVKDAIADQFRYYFNQRPDVGRNDADININVYISGNKCEVSLNSSGVPLFKRGYRKSGHKAPINEVLAAGLVKLSGWDMDSNFIDPMCGSGTLLVEAALMAYNFPPAFLRESFSFMNWSNYDPTIWRKINEETNAKQKEFEHRIIGGDISEKNLRIAEEIIKEIRFHKDIELVLRDIKNHHAPEGEIKGWVVTNPPYGERLKSKDLEGLYSSIGDAFKNNFTGYKAWMISSDMDALKAVGLKTSIKIPLFNGPLECRFNAYDLYEGTKRIDVENTDKNLNTGSNNDNSNDIEIEKEIIIENELLTDLYVSNKIKESDDKREGEGERRPYRGDKREGGGERRSYGGNRREGEGERRPYRGDKREGGGERRSYGGNRREGEGERRPYRGDKREGGGERRSYGGNRREGEGERRPYRGDKKEGRGERRSYGGNRREGEGERRPYRGDKREGGGERRSYGSNRREGEGERRPYRGDKREGSRRNYDNKKKRDDNEKSK